MENDSVDPPSPDSILVADTGQIKLAAETATIRTRANFAGQHLLAAAKFARMSGEVETAHTGGSSTEPFFTETVTYATGTILTAGAALEAYINQVFIDGKVFPIQSIGANTEELWDIWWDVIERRDIWTKYNLALELRNKLKLSQDNQSPLYPKYLSAHLLVDIRNALIHFKPQWDDEKKAHHQLTNRLLNESVRSSPFGSCSPLFPHDFMSHDMARWAVKTAWQFIEAFSQGADLENTYAFLIDELNPGFATWPLPS